MPAKQATNWIITDYSVNQAKWEDLAKHENTRCIAWQKEQCPDTGRMHFQAFWQLKAKKTASWVKEAILDSPHIEVVKKNKCDKDCQKCRTYWDQGIEAPQIEKEGKMLYEFTPCGYHYCVKKYTRVEGPWEFGERVSSGSRTDLLDVQELLDKGASMKQVYSEYFEASAKYYRFFKEYQQEMMPERTWMTEPIIFFGPTRTGKSEAAHQYAKDENLSMFKITKDKQMSFPFNKYNGQELVLWDEFQGSQASITSLLELIDRYPHKVRGMGGFPEFLAKKIIFTSNLAPWEWYQHANIEHVKALAARISESGKIIKFNAYGDMEEVKWDPARIESFIDEQGNKGVRYVPANAE